jgi:segregation and condensation protein A
MVKTLLKLNSKNYELQLTNFEGPLDLLLYLIEKNKMDIYQVKIDEIADQYIDFLNESQKLNLEIASEFLVMASTLLLIKSKGLLPKTVEDEAELTEEELLRRIIEYKKYKEITKVFKDRLEEFSKRVYKKPDDIELPKQKLEQEFNKEDIINAYKVLVNRNQDKKNEDAKNIEKIAIHETYTVAEKVKDIVKALTKTPRLVFSKMFKLGKQPKAEVVTAFEGVLELGRQSKITTEQEELFGEIILNKRK